jgi:hypothetical protein
MMRSLLREPLVHFLVLGALLFGVGVFVRDDGPSSSDILVTEGQIEQLAERFRRTWQRPPTADELRGLVQDHVREEIYYREALAMGLDQEDAVIRRRLRQKMEFFSQDLALQADPTEEELAQYLAQHPEQFRTDGRIRFAQVFVNADRRGDAAADDAERILGRLRSRGVGADPNAFGDPLMLGATFDRSDRDVASLFGFEFVDGLADTPVGEWTGPITSGFGLHLVLVYEREEGTIPPLERVADAVRREVLAERQRTLNEEVYARFLERYDVRVVWPEGVQANAAEEAER